MSSARRAGYERTRSSSLTPKTPCLLKYPNRDVVAHETGSPHDSTRRLDAEEGVVQILHYSA